ncbi:MAG: tRNA (adenine-N1)-methyltransferase [Archaeoglobus sp.]|jgi:tRNA (adenine57-N1/adenine58-N1)-methyltransferase|nr:MAG: tRNA (adenine-N1)-methyltransferase [Archaeoglobus sp.]
MSEKLELPVVLVSGKDSFLVTSFKGELHTHKGVINLEELTEKNYGDEVRTHKGQSFKILPFSPSDFFRHFRRSATPIMPKDIGAIIAMSGLRPDSLVLDAGTGSGMLAAYIAYFNRYGEVITVEKRRDFAEVARKNFKLAKLKNIHQLIGDVNYISDGFKKEFDLIVLDMKDDYVFIPKAKDILRVGGYLAVYNPYIEPSKRVYEIMKKADFVELECFELLKSNYEFKKIGTRPVTRVWHTGFIVIGRKC